MSLVLWFKGAPGAVGPNGGQQPIYTVDARQRPLSSGAARHLVADSMRGRARFVVPQMAPAPPSGGAKPNESLPTGSSAPYLEISSLEAEDQAEYRCRVDYRSRPRENFLIVLFVLGKFGLNCLRPFCRGKRGQTNRRRGQTNWQLVCAL